MKSYSYKIFGLILVAASMNACNDSFLERNPTHDLHENAFWESESHMKIFADGIYNLAGNNGQYTFMVGHAQQPYNGSLYETVWFEAMTDNFASRNNNHAWASRVAAGQEIIPTSVTRGGWYWTLLRNCNYFLENYEKAESVSEERRNFYAGEALFFRAWFYLDKVQRYGDVPLITTALELDSPELYYPRDPRKTVMEQVLKDINRAIEYLPESWADQQVSEVRASKYAALALKSRICLYEGTFRKYHGLGDYEEFLKEAVAASEELMKSDKFTIHNTGNPYSDYRDLFITEDLEEIDEVIFYRKYVTGVFGHRICGYLPLAGTGATKDFVDDFLCIEDATTALPVSLSNVYSEDTWESVFDNRDPRLAQTILDPRDKKDIFAEGSARSTMEWPRFTGMEQWPSATGYHLIKYYDRDQDAKGYGNESHDSPLMRYAEVLLNLAEAKAELGTITQSDIDQTINLLRDRAGVPRLNMDQIVPDPKYQKEIEQEGLSPLLIEIRRERRVELSFEQLRYTDIMRWKKGEYLAKQVLGARFEPEYFNIPPYDTNDVKDGIAITKVGDKHYVDVYYGHTFYNRNFDEKKHYYFPIELAVIASNDNIEQNPFWE